VTFPMYEKVVTRGYDQCDLYAFLSQREGSPKWNFHKYLVGKDGKVIRSFPTQIAPDNPELIAAIQAALKE
jgi:glutathione peroxidase